MIGRVFRDKLFIMMMAFMMMVIWMLPFINDPTEQDQSIPPGNILVYITWPEGPVDVDLWVKGPGDRIAVGFSNMRSDLWNNLRDDVGDRNDPLPLNFENSYSRGTPEGRYWFNLHCFSCATRLNVPVQVEISIRRYVDGEVQPSETLFTGEFFITHRQEVTMVSFELDAKGKEIPGSRNNVLKRLKPVATEGGPHSR